MSKKNGKICSFPRVVCVPCYRCSFIKRLIISLISIVRWYSGTHFSHHSCSAFVVLVRSSHTTTPTTWHGRRKTEKMSHLLFPVPLQSDYAWIAPTYKYQEEKKMVKWQQKISHYCDNYHRWGRWCAVVVCHARYFSSIFFLVSFFLWKSGQMKQIKILMGRKWITTKVDNWKKNHKFLRAPSLK